MALQGLKVLAILQPLTDVDLSAMKYYRFADGEVLGEQAMVSRTGYTGEDGFEVMVPSELGERIASIAMSAPTTTAFKRVVRSDDASPLPESVLTDAHEGGDGREIPWFLNRHLWRIDVHNNVGRSKGRLAADERARCYYNFGRAPGSEVRA